MLEKNKILRIFLIVFLASNIIFNEFLITGIASDIGSDKTMGAQMNMMTNRIFSRVRSASVVEVVMARGVPEKYGAELNLSFDRVQESMNAMKVYDQSEYGKGQIKLSGEKMKRYAGIGQKIACEFCCSAKAITREDGTAACACGHSVAMRGLAAYLIEKHGNEYTDDEILRELARWKGVYFPRQMVDKVTRELNSGSYSADVSALLSNVDKDKLKQSIKDAPVSPSNNGEKNLPGQQGGC